MVSNRTGEAGWQGVEVYLTKYLIQEVAVVPGKSKHRPEETLQTYHIASDIFEVYSETKPYHTGAN